MFEGREVTINGIRYVFHEERASGYVVAHPTSEFTGPSAIIQNIVGITIQNHGFAYPVTELVTGTFANNTNLTSVVIPENLIIIRAGEFNNSGIESLDRSAVQKVGIGNYETFLIWNLVAGPDSANEVRSRDE